jgi:serine/threonine-protein kinase
MGTVFEAVDAAGAGVAVKTLSAHLGDDAGLRARFAVEIEALKALRHPGIVRLLAFGEEEGRPFFAMELVRGRSLEEILKSGKRFDWQETVAIAADVARALKSAHDQGIVHRDLKPANLLFPAEPGPESRVKLADFGIARLFGDTGHTQAGTVVGTAEYMAPEQAAGSPVDARVDLYALGLVMFAMLTGRPPFRGGDVTEVLRRQRKEPPPRVSAIVPEVPDGVDDLVARLLAKDPADRPPNALAVGRLLATLRDGLGSEAAGDASAAAAHPRNATPTLPIGSSPGSSGIDLLAATRVTAGAARGTPEPAATQAFMPATARDGRSLAHRATEPSRGGAPAAPPVANRFTTVEELQRVARVEAERFARRDRWVRLVTAGGLIATVLAGGYVMLQPLTADQIHDRIRAIADTPAADLRDARPMIELFLARFPADPRADSIRDLERELDLDALERRVRRRPRADEALPPIERDYRAAIAREAESPLACLAALEAILTLHADDPPTADVDPQLWLDLVRRQIERVTPLAAREREEDLGRAAATLAEARALAVQAEAAAKAERVELVTRQRDLLEGLVEIYATRPHLADAVAEARALLAAQPSVRPPQTPPESQE